MAAAASSSSSSPQSSNDVFLSFRGEETRNNFTAHLKEALRRSGIGTFMDDDKLQRGEVISEALHKAIERSRCSIIVLSQNYASSGWCLDELVKIVECMKSRRQRVLPIFYNVDPSDVRKQRGKIGEALAKHEENLENVERVKVWKKALTEVANLAGWDSRNKNESMLIKDIITSVSKNVFSMCDEKSLIGIWSRIEELESLLCLESYDVRIVGIWGMAGIGKTTLADAVYNRVCRQFASSAFLPNVGEVVKKEGLIGLKQKLLSLLVDDGKLNIRGCTSLKPWLSSKKVLIVLDDVQDEEVIQYFTENKDSLFGQGSRIIITTKDKQGLTSCSVKHYEVRKLNRDEAMEVLTPYSLKHELPRDDYMELSKGIINYAQGLPLALRVLGPALFGMKKPKWRSHLDKLKSSPHPKINEALQISYDELDNKAKNIFLDIACFFKEEDKDHVMEILEACGFYPDSGIRALLDKNLITISNSSKLQMHDLIQDMGMEIVRQKYPNEPGKWSRLWSHEDVSRVLKKNTGTEVVQGIFLNLSNLREIKFTSGFARMDKLRLLKIYTSHISEGSKCTFQKEEYCKVHFSWNFKFHSDDLRYLYWHGYSLKSLPYDFKPENLVELNMPYSHIKQLWKGNKDLEKLKFMELSHSQSLVKTPDLSRATNLERLVLEGCTDLRAVDPSLAGLKKLIFLSLRDCINLRDFPSSIELESLKIFILSGCSKLRKFPEVKGHMKHLSELLLDGTAIKKLPSSIEYATGLVVLDLRNCKKLKSLPNGICNLESLETLLLSDCKKLESLPQNFGKLKGLRKLHADRTLIRGLPDDSFVDLRFNLEEVSFSGCKEPPTFASRLLPWKRPYSLDFLLPPLSALCFLKDLNLSDCNVMDWSQLEILSHLSSLKTLNLSRNNFVSLPSSISQLPRLTTLKLLNCSRLQVLPDLPSSIEVINAHNCISLEAISNQWQCAWLRHAIFTNCSRMKEHQSNMESSFGTLVTKIHQFGLMSRYHPDHDHGRPIVFRTLIPGSEIPDWFSYQNNSWQVTTGLPNNWNNSNFLGFALCAVLSLKDLIHQKMHYLTCGITSMGGGYGLPTMIDFIPHRFEDGLIESDHIWMAYAPSPLCSWPHSVRINVSFQLFGFRNAVKSCGFRLVYIEDVGDNNATMIQHISSPQHSSVILEELDHSIPEDSQVGSSLDPRDPSGSNEDEYHTAEDLSSSDCSNEDLESESIDYCYTNEGDQTLRGTVPFAHFLDHVFY